MDYCNAVSFFNLKFSTRLSNSNLHSLVCVNNFSWRKYCFRIQTEIQTIILKCCQRINFSYKGRHNRSAVVNDVLFTMMYDLIQVSARYLQIPPILVPIPCKLTDSPKPGHIHSPTWRLTPEKEGHHAGHVPEGEWSQLRGLALFALAESRLRQGATKQEVEDASFFEVVDPWGQFGRIRILTLFCFSS